MISIAKKIVELLRNENITIQKAKIALDMAARILEQEPLAKNTAAQSKCAAAEEKG